MSKNSDLRFVSFNKYVREPVKEYAHKGWVLNGNNNSFYSYLVARYKGSTTHKAVCDSYSNLIYGQGLFSEGVDRESEEWKGFLKLFSKRDQRRVILDFVVLGELSFQIIRQKGNRSKPAKFIHIEKSKVVPSIEDLDGNITSYWYSRDWEQQWKTVNGVRVAEPKQYPALGFGTGNEVEIYVGKPYDLGSEYFSDPEYLPILPYAEFEEEVANYYLKYIKNGLSLGNIVNVPNSVNWSDDVKNDYEKKVKSRLTGSENANSMIISFNGGEENTTIESIKNEYAHKQWDFLTVEARQQILTGHKATSSSLVGVNASSGFSSTAEEMDEAEHQLMKRVISPKQGFIIDSVREVLEYFNMDMPLGFVPLTEKKVVEDTAIVEQGEEAIELSYDCNCEKKKSDLDYFLDLGEEEDLENFDLIDEIEVDYDEEVELASTGTARPNAKSSQDGEEFIVRYKYVGNKSPERDFCQKMMSAKKIYRKEDILQLSNKVVNAGWGANGADTYSIWFYKGGGACRHKWNRVIYLKKGASVDANSPLAKTISTSAARRKGYKIETNDTLVSIAPNKMTNNGFLKPRK
tara:strand:- start:3130 stop:4857 length:1728 start_codon:yes stop_codon:yes gene_type:complete